MQYISLINIFNYVSGMTLDMRCSTSSKLSWGAATNEECRRSHHAALLNSSSNLLLRCATCFDVETHLGSIAAGHKWASLA